MPQQGSTQCKSAAESTMSMGGTWGTAGLPVLENHAGRTSCATGLPVLTAVAIVSFAITLTSGCALSGRKPVPDHVLSARQKVLRGADAMQRSKWQEAEMLFAEAIESSPLEERAHAMYAETLWRRGEREEAIKHLEESVRLSAGDPNRLITLGEMQLQQNRLEEAGKAAATAIQTDRNLARAYALRGDVLSARGRLGDAMDRYNEALNIQSHYPQVQMAIAGIYQRQSRPHRALATLSLLEQQLTPDLSPYDLYQMRALAHTSLGRHRAAAVSYRRCAELQPNNPNVLVRLAESQQAAGDESSAKMAVEAALLIAPNHPQANQFIRRLASRDRTNAGRY
jgi:Tfp pilus assembly protein PilF